MPERSAPPSARRGNRISVLAGVAFAVYAAASSGCVTREIVVERAPAPAQTRPVQAPDDGTAPRVGLMGDLADPFAPDSERVALAPPVGWNADEPAPTVRYYSQSGDYDPDAVTVNRYYYGDEGTTYQDAPQTWGSGYDDAYYGGYYADYYRYGYVHYRPVVYNYYRPYYAYRPYRHYGRPFWAYAGHAYRGPWYAYHGGWYSDPHYWGPYHYDPPFFVVASFYDPFYYGGWYDSFCLRPSFAFGWGSYHDWGSYYAGYNRGYRDGYFGGYYDGGYYDGGYYGDGYGYRGRRYHEDEAGNGGDRGPLRPVLVAEHPRPVRVGLGTPTAERVERIAPTRPTRADERTPALTSRTPTRISPAAEAPRPGRVDRADAEATPARRPPDARTPRAVDQVRPPRGAREASPDVDDPRLHWVTPRPTPQSPAETREEPARRPRYYPTPRTARQPPPPDRPRYSTPPPREEAPRYTPPPRHDSPRYAPPSREEPARQSPPPREEAPRYTPPPREEAPRYSPPPREERRADPPRQERQAEPRRSESRDSGSRGGDDDRGGRPRR